jgi:flagellar basal-body rod protein FlgC
MTLLDTFDITANGMSVQRTRMNVAAMNMANKNTTRTAEGGPYRRRDVVLEAVELEDDFSSVLDRNLGGQPAVGVRVREIAVSDDEPILMYDPGHPDADEAGYVATPNVSGIKEMVNVMSAARAYEAGTSVLKSAREMADQALRIGR